ncbi:hypothetical protein J8273_8742 [Carpediemonas membranifera]|uniref:Uncharacterized protein n=1 Tax=Carpediemonas membranifera TaxID=201153 RepID=A0A8J6AQK3_9EUKA|nr:hypothetical protein J8273_8742 [Carpediemonas membranifera]|eukprot:KAG9389450.1 hypothetical protein J8273_8742 [Carpediemonas membranifera]
MKAFESAAVTAFKNSKRAEYAKENEGARIEKEALSVKVRAWRNATSTNALVRDHVTAMVARVRSKEADLAYMKHSCRSYFEEYIIALEWLETPAGEGTPLLPPGTGAIIDYYHKIVRGYKKRVKQLRKSLTAKSEKSSRCIDAFCSSRLSERQPMTLTSPWMHHSHAAPSRHSLAQSPGLPVPDAIRTRRRQPCL